MTINLRVYCRKCRGKLPAPVDNQRRAFCTRFCFDTYYRNRCVVCDEPFRRRSASQRTCIRLDCKAELRRFPLAYSWPETPGRTNTPQNDIDPLKSPDFIGLGRPLAGTRPPAHALSDWRWGNPVDGDLSLYDPNGLTIARLVQHEGRWHLRCLVTWPRMSWSDFEQAKRHSESLALSNLPIRRARNGAARE
jgi:hypothetical protein